MTEGRALHGVIHLLGEGELRSDGSARLDILPGRGIYGHQFLLLITCLIFKWFVPYFVHLSSRFHRFRICNWIWASSIRSTITLHETVSKCLPLQVKKTREPKLNQLPLDRLHPQCHHCWAFYNLCLTCLTHLTTLMIRSAPPPHNMGLLSTVGFS